MPSIDCLLQGGLSEKQVMDLLDVDTLPSDRNSPLSQADWDRALFNVKQSKKKSAMQGMALARQIEKAGGKIDSKRLSRNMAKAMDDKDQGLSLSGHMNAKISRYMGLVSEALGNYRSSWMGFNKSTQGVRNLVSEMRGKGTGDSEAAEYAKIFKKLYDTMHTDWKEAGGEMGTLKDFGTPQHHEASKIVKDREGWKQTARETFDWERMRVDSNMREDVLDQLWEVLGSGGARKADPTKLPPVIAKALSDTKQAHRIIHFKDADTFLRYNDAFGTDDLYGMILSDIDVRARNIAMMEVLGPDPDSTFTVLRNMARQTEGKDDAGKYAQGLYDTLNGTLARPVSQRLSQTAQSARALTAASMLGKALIATFSDLSYSTITAMYNGMGAGTVGRMYASQLRNLFTRYNKGDKQFVADTMLYTRHMIDDIALRNRFADVSGGHGLPQKLSDITIKASGMEGWDTASRTTASLEFSGFFGRNINKSIDKLPDGSQRMLARYGITPEDWKGLKKGVVTYRGSKMIDPSTLDDTDLAMKFIGMIQEEVQYAVPAATTHTQLQTSGGLPRGTWGGEAFRTAMMFKSFPLTILNTHLRRGWHNGGVKGRVAYLGAMGLSTTMLGMGVIAMKDILNGKEPIDPFRSKENFANSVLAGMVQGGAGSLMMDFALADWNQYGTKPLQGMITGPTIAEAERMATAFAKAGYRVAAGDLKEAWSGALSDGVQIGSKYIPGTNLWYSKMVFDRAVFEQAMLWADPQWRRKWNKSERKLRKETGQDMLIKRGESPF